MHAILITGAALVGLPILLHLIMKQEPKRLSFPAFRFLTQKLKTNQRKLRLRHFILLALRMLLIALFCLALYQPTLKSDRLNISGEQPIATVIVIDTSPSMGYTQNDQTRLQEAARRARELLDALPEKSPVAILTTDDPTGFWQRDISEARKILDSLGQPRGGTQPVTSALSQAYQLLAHIDSESVEEPNQLPKLLVVLTDRTAASWESGLTENLKQLRDAVPDPKPNHAVVDVGIDQPLNVAILGVEMKPQVIPANQPAVVKVTVAATGPPTLEPVEAVVVGELDGGLATQKRPARVAYGQSTTVEFKFEHFKPGMQRVKFSLEAPDKLAVDNTRFLTFRVGEARRVLVIADEPRSAAFWQIAVNSKEEFVCVAARPEDVNIKDGQAVVHYTTDLLADDPKWFPDEPIRVFDAVCLLSVENPNLKIGAATLWEKLRPYVEGGGKLVIIPGERLSEEGYRAGGNLMPGTIGQLIETAKLDPPPPPQTAPGWTTGPRPGTNGVTWALDKLQHPMLQPLREWQELERRDVLYDPRVAWKYWEVKKDQAPEAAVIVSYNDAEKPETRHPAVLERGIPDPAQPTRVRGRVVLLTTRMDVVRPDDEWNNYWKFDNSWSVVFPWLVLRYLAGDTADANFNHPTGRVVRVPLPAGGLPQNPEAKDQPITAIIEGPHLTTEESRLLVDPKQTELPIGPPQTNLPGNFRVSIDSAKWEDGYSLNAPAEESALNKVAIESIEELTGKGTVVVEKMGPLPVVFNQPIDLFPWLLIAVLLLLAAEGVVANRFYRRVQ